MTTPAPHRQATSLVSTFLTALLFIPVSDACSPDSPVTDAQLRAAPTLPEPTGDPENMDGSWWALSSEAAYRALRLELTPTEDPDAWTGSWTSFNWRGSENAESLSRPSLPVALSARIERQEVVITGPAPQFDASGTPNGDIGRWELRLRLVSPPDNPAVYSGIMVHDEYTSTRGVRVKLTRTFETWSG